MSISASNQRRSGRTASARLLITSLVIAGLFVLIACQRGSEHTSTNTNQATPPDKKDLLNQKETLIFDGREISWQEFFDSGGRCSTPAVSLVEGGRRGKPKEFPLDKKNLERTKLIEVYFHVINKGNTVSDGNIEKPQIDKQMSVLNDMYAGTNFQFKLVKVDRTKNPDWYKMRRDEPAEHAAMQQLGVKQKDVLNVYTAQASKTLGWAVYPWEFSASLYRDGVVIRFSTLPGGTSAPYDQGMTLVHEVGHWLGLLHTYENRCYAPGDYVDDTPPEEVWAGPTCPLGRNTCIDNRGPDPVDNFMNTSVDNCTRRFTPGQSDRMDLKFERCRRLGLPCSP